MVTNSLKWTTRDLDAMPDDGGWKRYEIIDGELFVTRAPHIRHQSVALKKPGFYEKVGAADRMRSRNPVSGQNQPDWEILFKSQG